MSARPIFVFAPRRPRSQNAASQDKYKEELKGYARDSVEAPLVGMRLYCKVCYFHRGLRYIDADNMSKPIIDALEGIAYDDDQQVVLRIAARIAIDSDKYEVVPRDDALREFTRFRELLAAEPDVLYIEIGELDNLRLTVGGAP